MGINSRSKGKVGEREAAKILRSYGYDTKRGQQYCGIQGDADVVGLPYMHLEIKRVEALNLDKAMEQSIRDAREGEVPIVMHRKNRKPWYVTLRLEEFMEMYKKWEREKTLVSAEQAQKTRTTTDM